MSLYVYVYHIYFPCLPPYTPYPTLYLLYKISTYLKVAQVGRPPGRGLRAAPGPPGGLHPGALHERRPGARGRHAADPHRGAAAAAGGPGLHGRRPLSGEIRVPQASTSTVYG